MTHASTHIISIFDLVLQGLEQVTKIFYACVAASGVFITAAFYSLSCLAGAVTTQHILTAASITQSSSVIEAASQMIKQGLGFSALWTGLSVLAVVISVQLWRFRMDRFVTGLFSYKRKGGSVISRENLQSA